VTASVLAAVAEAPLTTALRELPMPPVETDGGLLRVLSNGICGSDWAMYQDGRLGPRILGHEMVGVVEQLGDVARARWGLAEGDVIALEEYLPCGHCEYCREGEIRSCLATDSRVAGSIRYGSTPLNHQHGLWGGYAQYVYLHPRSVIHRVPAGLAPHIASMALPIGNGFQWAVLDGQAGPGKIVVVMGPGQQGLGCVVAARHVGADMVIAAGLARDEERLNVARTLGADHSVMTDQQELADEVKRLTNGRMADLVIDATGAGPAIVNPSVALLRKRGVLVVASRKGMPVFGFDIDALVNRQIVLRGTRGHSYRAVELALGVLASGRYKFDAMASHELGLRDVDRALRMVGGQTNERCVHVSIDPWK
jgi:threonine dehydrogenase-like Zn-dependent dehydrogenase